MRIASLLPAATETLYALGEPPVGVSHACDYPPPVEHLPTLVEPMVDPRADQQSIDTQVTATLEDRRSPYSINRRRLRAVEPDLLITQGLCEACAITDGELRTVLSRMTLDPEIVSFHPHTLDDILASIEEMGAVADRTERGSRLRATLEHRLERVRGLVAQSEHRPRVLVLDWTDPPMVAGHWVPDLIELAGGEPVLATSGASGDVIEWQTIQDTDPDVLIVAPCGLDRDRAIASTKSLRDRDGWQTLSAVQTDCVHAVDGSAFVNRPGPRIVQTTEILARLIHPSITVEETSGSDREGRYE